MNTSDIIVVTFFSIIIIFSLYMYRKTSKAQKQAKEKLRSNMTNKGASLSVTLPHLIGLNIPENSLTSIYSCPSSYEFESNGVTFTLNKNKVTDISMKTTSEIQKQIVSSIGGAIGGAVLFGPLGAMIGGRAKTKELRTVTTCLIFTYEKNNSIDYIAFNATNNLLNSNKLMNEFKQMNSTKENKKIEL